MSESIDRLEQMIVYNRAQGFHPVKLNQYPDGMPWCEQPSWLGGGNHWTILLRPKTFTDFAAGLFWVDALNERRPGSEVRLVLPFVPGARQDRLNSEGDWLFTAKSVARMINSRYFAEVAVLDPHSDVISGLIDRCRVFKPHELDLVYSELESRRYVGVVSPDAGAEKRAAAVAKRLQVPLFHAWKQRSVATGAISGFGHEAGIPPRHEGALLIVDDICDGGGTFVGLEKVLAETLKSGADDLRRPDLYITHGLFTKGPEILTSRFRNVFCTDSLPTCHPGIHYFDVCEQIVKEIST